MTPDNKFYFVRKEKKYLIDERRWNDLRLEVASRLYQERFRPTGSISCIESVYFDNASWKTFIDHKQREKRRFKLRIRQYSNRNAKCFIEVKEKKYNISYKRRFKIKPQWIDHFLNKPAMLDKLLLYNKKLRPEQLTYTYKKVITLLNDYEFVPVIGIRYQRESYKNRRSGLRITFDRKLCFNSIQNTHTKPIRDTYTYPRNIIIMETKYSGSRPKWLRELIKKYHLKKVRFSKYCTAVEKLYMKDNQMKDQIVDISEKIYAGISQSS